jgi:hypothetical protein
MGLYPTWQTDSVEWHVRTRLYISRLAICVILITGNEDFRKLINFKTEALRIPLRLKAKPIRLQPTLSAVSLERILILENYFHLQLELCLPKHYHDNSRRNRILIVVHYHRPAVFVNLSHRISSAVLVTGNPSWPPSPTIVDPRTLRIRGNPSDVINRRTDSFGTQLVSRQ